MRERGEERVCTRRHEVRDGAFDEIVGMVVAELVANGSWRS